MKPTDFIRRKIVFYVEASPEEMAKFQEGLQTVFRDYPHSLLLPREGSFAWQYDWPKVKRNLESIGNPWVAVSQPFIDPIKEGDFFPRHLSGYTEPPDDDGEFPT